MTEDEGSTVSRRRSFLLLAALTVALGLFVARYHTRAFPELSPRFSLKKSDVAQAAGAAAARLGFDARDYRRAVTFDEDGAAKYFFELQYGLERLSGEVARGVSIWSWQTRYFKPQTIEEFSVELDTEGALVGFSHTLPDEEKLPRLGRDEALALAEAFIARHVPRHPAAELKLTETKERERVGHGVVSFTWERRDWTWGDGTYHLHVSVAGDSVSRYYEHVDVPEAWSRDFRKRRSANQLFQGAAGALTGLLFLLALVQTVGLLRRRALRGRDFPRLWALAAALVVLAAAASGAATLLAGYATNDSFPGHVARGALWMVLGAGGVAVLFWALGVLGDGFLRSAFPGRVSLGSLLCGRGVANRESLRSIALAFPLAMVSLAWVTGYYIVGRSVGVWSPSSIDNSKVFTSFLPAVEALSVGLVAGWTEELLFRGIFLVALWKLTRSKWAAIVVTAAAWGFLHSTYPQLPGYARGLELTAMGVLLGWAATRYGILTTVLSHCLYNTWIGAIVAWKTGDATHMAMAAAVSLWPAGLWAAGRLRVLRHGAHEEAGEPDAPPRHHPAPAPVVDTRLRALTPAWVAAALILSAALLATLSLLPDKPLADLGAVTLSRAQALRLADAAFGGKTGLDPQSFRRIVDRNAGFDASDADYLLRHASAEALAALYRQHLWADEWTVRYFRDGERDDWRAHLSPRGELRYLARSIAETAPGAQLERDEAVGLAEGFLRAHYGLAPPDYRFLDIGVTQQKARRDYAVTFESTRWQVGESRLRWTVSLLGDELRHLGTSLKLPEEYERERDATGWGRVLQEALQMVFGLGMIGGGVALLCFFTARGFVPWRPCLLLALLPLALTAASQANLAPEFFAGYDTAQSLASFATRKALGSFTSLLGAYLSAAALLALVAGLVRWLTDRPVGAVLLGGSAAEARRRYLHGLVFAALGASLSGWLGLLKESSSLGLSGKALLAWSTPHAAGFSPGAAALLSALSRAVESSLGTGAIVLALVAFWKKKPLLCAAGAALLLLPDFGVKWRGLETVHAELFDKAGTILQAWLFLRVFRFNPFPYLLMHYHLALLPSASVMTAAAWPALSGDIALLWGAAAAPLLPAAALLIRRRFPPDAPERRAAGSG